MMEANTGAAKLILGGVILLFVLLCFQTQPGSPENILSIVLLAIVSRLATGSLIVFFVVTAMLATAAADLHGDTRFETLYLPLYVMFSSIYILCFLVSLYPGLGKRGGGYGVGPGGDIGGGGGGDGGC